MTQRERQEGDIPAIDQAELDREAEKSREEIESVPEHGSDPLHEGP